MLSETSLQFEVIARYQEIMEKITGYSKVIKYLKIKLIEIDKLIYRLTVIDLYNEKL